MTDEAHRDLSLKTNRDLQILTNNVSALTDSMTEMSTDMKEVVKVVLAQTVMNERMNNMDTNVKEFADRVYGSIRAIEKAQAEDGCPALKTSNESIRSVGRSIDHLRGRVEAVEKKQADSVSSTVLRWSVAIVASYMVVFGTYVVKDLHKLDTLATEKIHMQRGINNNQQLVNENTVSTFKELGTEIHQIREYTNRNYGFLKGTISGVSK